MSTAITAPTRRPAAGWSIDLETARLAEVIDRVENGLAIRAAEQLKQKLALANEELAALLHTSARTLARRRKQGRLTPDESDRLYRLARLYEQAVDVLGTEDEARRWLKRPQWGLGGVKPLSYAHTEPGVREVENLLGRIEYGVLA